MLPRGSEQQLLVERVSALLAQENLFDAAAEVGAWVSKVAADNAAANNLPAPPAMKRPTKKEDAYSLLSILLHWCLNNGGTEDAAQLLWGETQFDPRPRGTQRVWKAFDTQNFILLMGAGKQSKSFSMAVRLFLEWIRDPEYTTVKVLGPSEQHLEDNLFSHLISLHNNSRIPLPGQVGKLFIGLDLRSRKSSITGVIIPLGQKAAGRLQGVARIPRKKPHPIFGPLSRLFVFLDEIANIPPGIWRDIDNLLSNVSGDGMKIIGAFNPTNQADPVGQRCEPPFGWKDFDPDEHFEWMSTRGWFVVRLDAAQSENIQQRRVVFPGLQTIEGFEQIITNSGGTNSPGYWSMARGCFPPLGTLLSIVSPGMLTKFKCEVIWYDTPTPAGGVDLAFEGGDAAKFAFGRWGLATGLRFPPDLEHPNGVLVMFKNKKGRPYPRYMLQLEQIFTLEKGDTVVMEEAVKTLANKLGIRPEWLAVDKTGSGSGTYDLLKFNWGQGTIGVNFYEGAEEKKILVEDSDTADKLYSRENCAMWFALRQFIQFSYLKMMPGADIGELITQMTGRLFRSVGKQSKVEKKADYKARNQGKSPDDADSVCLLVKAVRTASGITIAADPDNIQGADNDDDYFGEEEGEKPRCDITNRFSEMNL